MDFDPTRCCVCGAPLTPELEVVLIRKVGTLRPPFSPTTDRTDKMACATHLTVF